MRRKILRCLSALFLAGVLSSGILSVLDPQDGTGLGHVPAAGACPIIEPDCPH